MRGYTVATVALALDVPVKWIDNTLSHHRVSGVVQARQGIARRLTTEAVVVLETALQLMRSLEIPTARALHVAQELVAMGEPRYSTGTCEVRLNLDQVRAGVAVRLAYAVEISPVPRRGRPPKGR